MLEISKYKCKLSHPVSPRKDLLLTYKSSNDVIATWTDIGNNYKSV